MSAGRGYIIRFYREADEKAYFIGDTAYRSKPFIVSNLGSAKLFEKIDDAEKYVVDNAKVIKKTNKNGYLYISKVFYKENNSYGNVKKSPTKLTKPDRYDFLNKI